MTWQPIETCPKPSDNKSDSVPFMVWDGDWMTIVHCTEYSPGSIRFWVNNSYGFNEDGEVPRPTHWMQLPEPPNG